jgi:H+/Cl- antiporter ClcA
VEPIPPIPRLLVTVGLALVVVGLLAWALQGRLNWFGRLPGDIRVERENFRFYAPLATMLVLSVLLTLIVHLVRRFWP